MPLVVLDRGRMIPIVQGILVCEDKTPYQVLTDVIDVIIECITEHLMKQRNDPGDLLNSSIFRSS